jgi:phosphate uptake regulator
MLAAWLASGIDAPLERVAKRQSVRRYKDELMVSLPRDWQRRAGIAAGDRVTLGYSDDALIIRAG